MDNHEVNILKERAKNARERYETWMRICKVYPDSQECRATLDETRLVYVEYIMLLDALGCEFP